MTIKDIAKACGVSVSTVSRVLNNHPDVSQSVRERVQAMVESSGYIPNNSARDLVRTQSDAIGVVVRGRGNLFFSAMVKTISREIDSLGYTMVLHFIESDDDEVMAGAILEREKKLRGILFLGGRTTSRTQEQRIRGFRRALAEAGLEGRELPAPPDATLMRQWSYEAATELFKGPLPDAIFAFSDMTALKILEAAEEQGVRIPEDVSLLGYDNIAFASLPRIHLTTVSQRKFQQSRIAVERLLEKINGSTEQTVDLLAPELIIRSTCAKNRSNIYT